MTHVFLTYALEDAHLAARLRDAFKASGRSVWYDADALRAGESWVDTVDAAMEAADLQVVLVPRDTRQIANIGYEVGVFRAMRKPSIFLRPDDRNGEAFQVSNQPHLIYRPGDEAAIVDQIVGELAS